MSADRERDADLALMRASQDLVRARDAFLVSMTALEHEITHSLDWRQWVRRRPGVALGFAFGLGLLLGRKHQSFLDRQLTAPKDTRR